LAGCTQSRRVLGFERGVLLGTVVVAGQVYMSHGGRKMMKGNDDEGGMMLEISNQALFPLSLAARKMMTSLYIFALYLLRQ